MNEDLKFCINRNGTLNKRKENKKLEQRMKQAEEKKNEHNDYSGNRRVKIEE